MSNLQLPNMKSSVPLVIIGFIVIILLMVPFAFIVLYENNKLAQLNDKMYRHPFTVSNEVLEANLSIISMHRYMKDVVLATNEREMAMAISLVNKYEQDVYRHFDLIRERFLGSKETVNIAYSVFVNWKPIREEVIVLRRSNQYLEASAITTGKGAEHVRLLSQRMSVLKDYAHKKAVEFNENSKKTYEKDSLYMSILLVFIVFSSVATGFFVVTRIKKSELLLSNSEERFNLVLEGSNLGFWDWDIQSGKVYRNHIWAKILGYTYDEIKLTTHQWADFVHPDDIQNAWKSINDVIDGHTSEHDLVYRLRTKSGEYKWILDRAKVVQRDAKGKAVRMSGTHTDYTERKKTEEHLLIAATAFESQEGMMVTDDKKVIIRVNKAFTLITGYDAKEVIGHNPKILSSGRHDAAFYEKIWKVVNTTGFWAGEIWSKRKNGDVYPEDLTITAVKNTDGIVTNYVATISDISLRKQAELKIKDLAYYDPLTHLPNRRLMLDRINHALAVSTRSGKEGALLFLDLDHFKTLNDTLGHDKGDLLLQQIADRLKGCIREDDTVSRFGGDEYVVLVEGLSAQPIEAASQIDDIANKILSSINSPYLLASHSYTISTSIGITLFGDHQFEAEELLKQADIAMYQSKENGRNTLCFFDPRMQEKITARAILEIELNQAIEQQQFQLYYQIQVDDSGQPIGAEALIRWVQPERGLIYPIDFIPLAEQNGTILLIGLWVLDTACGQLKAWQQDLLTQELTLSINVSAKQFRQADFISQVTMTIQKHAINPARLKLELTETLLLDDIKDTIAKMDVLAEIGIQFSLDDFGTGYSSLQYLKKLPLYQLKIDKSFVDDLVTDSDDQAIVRTIIAIADSLGMSVIAEGVETKEQQQRLLFEGCTHYQGYFYSKPVPIDEFEALLIKADC